AGVAVKVALAGQGYHLLADQPLLIVAVAQPFRCSW
ncbi:hypothetical protein DET60_1391, partial [Raoultella planticola]